MKYRKFGKLDWNISEIGFGAWAIGGDMWGPQKDEESVKALHKAIDLGVNFIDTAQGYGNGHSEEIIGKVLKNRSEDIFIATKIPPVPGISWPPPDNYPLRSAFPKSYIIEKCEESLRRLGRDTIDVYQFHTWSVNFNNEDEWFEAVEELKKAGKIRAFGVSVPDTTPDIIISSIINGRIDSVQLIFNLFEQYPKWNILPVCGKYGTAVIVRVPFDEGALTGKYTPETKFPDGDVRNHYFRGNNLKKVIERVDNIKKYFSLKYSGQEIADSALRFCLSEDNVSTVIPGIRNIRQAELNTSVSDGKLFAPEEMKDMEKFYWRKNFWFEEEKN
ncbi:MAG: aldo/keto reductase [Melioribacteraceae bacterium]|nr:aldo/keto reductase [Melioribacteraceae bacterium]